MPFCKNPSCGKFSPKTYCSILCKNKYNHEQDKARKGITFKECLFCKQKFIPKCNQIYCSHECYDNSSKIKQKQNYLNAKMKRLSDPIKLHLFKQKGKELRKIYYSKLKADTERYKRYQLQRKQSGIRYKLKHSNPDIDNKTDTNNILTKGEGLN